MGWKRNETVTRPSFRSPRTFRSATAGSPRAPSSSRRCSLPQAGRTCARAVVHDRVDLEGRGHDDALVLRHVAREHVERLNAHRRARCGASARKVERVASGTAQVERLVAAHDCRTAVSCHPAEHGLAGQDVPLVAGIVCCCDAYNAMTTDRPYRAALLAAEVEQTRARSSTRMWSRRSGKPSSGAASRGDDP